MKKVTVYGADWCPLTTGAVAHLKQLGVPFQYVDLDHDPAASEWVKSQSNGKEKKPTIDVEGKILVEPTNAELESVLS